jgi:hypothetical protein
MEAPEAGKTAISSDETNGEGQVCIAEVARRWFFQH